MCNLCFGALEPGLWVVSATSWRWLIKHLFFALLFDSSVFSFVDINTQIMAHRRTYIYSGHFESLAISLFLWLRLDV